MILNPKITADTMGRYNGNHEIHVYIKYIFTSLSVSILMILTKAYIIKLGEMHF